MPAIWELQLQGAPSAKKSVAVLVPHLGEVTVEWAISLKNLKGPEGTQIFFSRGMPIDVTREQMVRDTLAAGFEWIFFLDSDVILPDHAILTLLSHNLPLVSGVYDAKKREGFYPAMWVRTNVNGKDTLGSISSWQGRLIKVDVVGTGCMLVHRSIFEKIRQSTDLPFFLWTKERNKALLEKLNIPDELMKDISEDFFFCLLAKKFGGCDVVVDTEVWGGHITTVKLFRGKADLPAV